MLTGENASSLPPSLPLSSPVCVFVCDDRARRSLNVPFDEFLFAQMCVAQPHAVCFGVSACLFHWQGSAHIRDQRAGGETWDHPTLQRYCRIKKKERQVVKKAHYLRNKT